MHLPAYCVHAFSDRVQLNNRTCTQTCLHSKRKEGTGNPVPGPVCLQGFLSPEPGSKNRTRAWPTTPLMASCEKGGGIKSLHWVTDTGGKKQICTSLETNFWKSAQSKHAHCMSLQSIAKLATPTLPPSSSKILTSSLTLLSKSLAGHFNSGVYSRLGPFQRLQPSALTCDTSSDSTPTLPPRSNLPLRSGPCPSGCLLVVCSGRCCRSLRILDSRFPEHQPG